MTMIIKLTSIEKVYIQNLWEVNTSKSGFILCATFVFINFAPLLQTIITFTFLKFASQRIPAFI